MARTTRCGVLGRYKFNARLYSQSTPVTYVGSCACHHTAANGLNIENFAKNAQKHGSGNICFFVFADLKKDAMLKVACVMGLLLLSTKKGLKPIALSRSNRINM